MEHKIIIEILIKTDFLKPEEKQTSKAHILQVINPEVIKSLLPKLMDDLIKGLPQKLPEEKKETKKKKTKKEVKK